VTKKSAYLLRLVVLLIAFSLFWQAHAAWAQSGVKSVLVLTLDGPLTPAMLNYLNRGLSNAAQENAELVLLKLNTPGGSINLMNVMVQAIRASDIPVVVYVSPNGAMAASAGTLITLSGHAAAMAPETAIGAASPVGPGGEDLTQTESLKVKQMIEATARSFAERRGPAAVALANDTIENARAASATEAKQAGLIDFISGDQNDLLRQLNGFKVTTSSGDHILDTTNLQVVVLSTSIIEQLLAALTDPNIVFLFLNVGVIALLIELATPGGWVAGFAGIVCLALAGYGLNILPVNWFGLIFIFIAFILFILDIKAPTHGALTATGVGSFIAGALVLFNSPGVPSFERVSVPLVVGASLITAGLFFTVLLIGLSAQHLPARSAAVIVAGLTGIARSDLNPTGTVQVGSELWTAELEEGSAVVEKGSQVEVIHIDGLHIKVRPVVHPKGG
jgi:membrane-bound serine protease (ClpP class)